MKSRRSHATLTDRERTVRRRPATATRASAVRHRDGMFQRRHLALAVLWCLLWAVPAVAAVQQGTPKPDVLVGTAGPDRINGRGGDDRIPGRAGHDRPPGGGGNAPVRGGARGGR